MAVETIADTRVKLYLCYIGDAEIVFVGMIFNHSLIDTIGIQL